MNINEMSDEQKSVMLARLCGWHVADHDEQPSPTYKLLMFVTGSNEPLYSTSLLVEKTDGFFEKYMPNLYDPANMALAWRVLNWAVEQKAIYTHIIDWWFDRNMDKDILGGYLFDFEPNKAQRAWLDKILTLAIEAGIVTK